MGLLVPNISVNTDLCKRRFAPPARAGYFNVRRRRQRQARINV